MQGYIWLKGAKMNKQYLGLLFLCNVLFLIGCDSGSTSNHKVPPSDKDKKHFLKMLMDLPKDGDVFADEAVKQCGSYMPILFALNESDISVQRVYPVIVLSAGLCDPERYPENVLYAQEHFESIQHPSIKLFWACMLYSRGGKNQEIMEFMKQELKSSEGRRALKYNLRENWDDFVKEVEGSDTQ